MEISISRYVIPQVKGTEQDDIINQFLVELNKERGTRKPLTFMAVKMKLYAVRNNKFDLCSFLSECKDYRARKGSFSKYFFGKLKK